VKTAEGRAVLMLAGTEGTLLPAAPIAPPPAARSSGCAAIAHAEAGAARARSARLATVQCSEQIPVRQEAA